MPQQQPEEAIRRDAQDVTDDDEEVSDDSDGAKSDDDEESDDVNSTLPVPETKGTVPRNWKNIADTLFALKDGLPSIPEFSVPSSPTSSDGPYHTHKSGCGHPLVLHDVSSLVGLIITAH